jgi:hypothetical protein
LKISEAKQNSLKIEVNSIKATISKNDRSMREIAIGLNKMDQNSKAWSINMSQIDKLDAENEKLTGEADKKQERLNTSNARRFLEPI